MTTTQITRRTEDGRGNVVSVETITVPDPRPRTAKELLEKSDGVAIRCAKANVSYPQNWQEYDAALRSIANGADIEIPTRPEYPEGT